MKLTNENMDDLVDEWHEDLGRNWNMPLISFLCLRTELSYDDIVHWIETAELPEENK